MKEIDLEEAAKVVETSSLMIVSTINDSYTSFNKMKSEVTKGFLKFVTTNKEAEPALLAACLETMCEAMQKHVSDIKERLYK